MSVDLEAMVRKSVAEKLDKKSGQAKGWSSIPADSGYEKPVNKEDYGVRGARVVRALAANGWNADRAVNYLADRYKDKSTAQLLEKSLETGTPSAGGFLLMPEFLADEFVPFLREAMKIMDLGVRQLPMPRGSITIPGMATGSTVGWVGEKQQKPSTKPSFETIKMDSKKACAIVPISNDLLVEASVEVDRMVRDDLVRALAELLQDAMLFGDGTSFSPRGIANDDRRSQLSIAALIDGDNLSCFPEKLMSNKCAFTPGEAGWVFNHTIWKQIFNLKTTTGAYLFRDEMRNGQLLGSPFRVVTTVPTGSAGNEETTIFYGLWREVLLGVTREMEMALSNEAAFLDESSTLVSAFAKDCTLVRVIKTCDSTLRQGKCMVVSDDVHTV